MEDAHVAALLVRRCVSGDAAAWEEIVQKYHRRIYNICYRFAGSGDDAEDLTQEVFIKMYRTLNSYDVDRGAFMTWVTTITRNLLVDHFRKTKQERLTDSLDTVSSDHEDAMPLVRTDSRSRAGAGFQGTKPGNRRNRPPGPAEALPGAPGGCDSKGFTGSGLS